MIEIRVEGVEKTTRYLTDVERKQIPFALAKSLTRTAQDGQKALQDDMAGKFDRPTPYTLKSGYYTPANKINLTSAFGIKDRQKSKSANAPDEVLSPHFTGGGRALKASEARLRRQGFLDAGEFLAPGAGAKLDRYGNISRGQLQQIFSQIGSRNLSGSDNLATGSKRSKRHVTKAGVMFWSRGQQGRKVPLIDPATGIEYGYKGGSANHLPKGVWMRQGRNVRPILLAISRPTYSKRIDIKRIALDVVNRKFNTHFAREFAAAMATAR